MKLEKKSGREMAQYTKSKQFPEGNLNEFRALCNISQDNLQSTKV